MNMKRILALAALLMLGIGSASAAEGGLRAVRATGSVLIDGKLDDAAWKSAPEYGVFVNTETKKQAPVRSSVKVLFDDKAIYLGIRCEEPNVSEMTLLPLPPRADVYGRDSIEIMLDPGHTQQFYWHFMVGAQNTIYDAYRDNSIGITEEAWNGSWNARSFIGKNFWSCEVKIPFFNFARRQPISGEWGINVVRNRRTARRANFAICGVYHDPTKFLPLVGIDCDLKPYQVELAPLAVKTGIGAKGEGYVETTTSVANYTGSEQTYRAENYLTTKEGDIAFSKPILTTVADGGKAALELAPVRLKKPGEVVNFVRVVDKAGRVVVCREAKTEVGFTPLAIQMIDPHYRYCIFATQKLETIAFDVSLKLPAANRKDKTLAVEIGAPGAKPVWEKQYKSPGAETKIRIPNRDFPEGRFEVRVKLLDAKGAPVKFAVAQCPLWKLPYKKGETWISKDLRVMREGKPRFTVRTEYGLWPDTPDATVIIGMHGPHIPRRPGQLWISGDFLYRMAGRRVPEFLKGTQTGAFRKQDIDRMREIIRKYRDVPELYAWLWFDEPSAWSKLPAALDYLYQVMKEEDPWHPVWGSDAKSQMYLSSMDVHEHHPYTASNGPRDVISDCTNVAYWADPMFHSQARSYHKTALAFTDKGINMWDWCLGGSRRSRIPTVLEFHNQLLMALAIGANHVQAYCNEAYCYPEFYIGWFGFLPEVRYIGEHAVQERHVPQPKTTGSKDLRRIAADTEDGYFLVASNVSTEKCQVTFTDLPKHLTKLYVVAEKRTVPVKDGVMTDEFGPCAGRAYVEKEPPAFITVAELTEKVEARWRELAKPGNILFSREKGDNVERKASSMVVAGGAKTDVLNLWHLNDGTVSPNTGGYGLLLWTNHPNDKTPWIEFAPKQRPFALGRVVICGHDNSLAKFHIEVFAKGAWKTVYTCEDGAKSNHFDCKFTPVPDAERFRVVVDQPSGKAPKWLNTKLPIVRISEIEAYAE